MISKLPEAYIERMRRMLGDEAEAFLASYGEPRTQGLRINPLKLTVESEAFVRMQTEFGLKPVPWCPTGYYYAENARPGKHPYHAAGLYYIQEPSAMSAVELLAPQPGETVLDLAAAPGGKSTQIAGKIGSQGLLVANEIHPARAKILSENLERMGCTNAVAVNASPDRLVERFPLFFDKIMLDAPCSGEGMFRKDPEAIGEWSPGHVAMCAARQLDIVRHAVRMLRPGGRLGYSTCTFSREENEELIEALIREFPGMELVKTERIWPHRQLGEGHFVAVLQKTEVEPGAGDAPNPSKNGSRSRRGSAAAKEKTDKTLNDAWKLFERFAQDTLPGLTLAPGDPVLFGEQLYWVPRGQAGLFSPSLLEGIKTPRPGLHLAAVKKSRVEPAHALALAIRQDARYSSVSFPADSPEISAYLHGETITGTEYANIGWITVCADGFALGWGKASGGQIKNHYPKGLRRV